VTGGRRFDPAELLVPGEPEPTPAEQADALATARDLEALAVDTGIRPTDGFEDRVMAAIAAEPAPRLVVAPATVRGGAVGAFLVTVRRSWAIAMGGGRPIAVRAQALAFVLLVVLAAGALTGVTAVTVGALLAPNGLTVGPDRSAVPTAPGVPETSESPGPSDTPAPSQSPTPEVTTSPTESPDALETVEPTKTARPTRTPKPGETPRATRTPRPTETPEATDDHGGDGGGGGSGSDGGSDGGGGKGPG
jgi:uncharacterized membrane protein YgcG